MAAVRFGRQRPASDVASVVLLFTGFCGLAAAFRLVAESWLGVLLPLAFVIGAWSALRSEVREIELGEEALFVRTIFRTYAMPRAHILRVVHGPDGPAVDVLNGARYPICPIGADPDRVERAVGEWIERGDHGPGMEARQAGTEAGLRRPG